MREAVIIPAGRIPETLRAVRSLVKEGSRSDSVRRLASALGGESVDPWERFALAYGALLQLWEHVPDPYGEELLRAPEVTAETLAGDCDDASMLVLALARSLGFRGAFSVLSVEEVTGSVTVQHAFAEVERMPGVWVAADLDERRELGAAPTWPGTNRADRFPVEDVAPGQIGFLPALLGAVAGIGAAIIGSKGSKDTARIQADAARDAVAGNLAVAKEGTRAALLQAQALQDQAEAAKESTRIATAGAERIALVNERSGALQTAASLKVVGGVLSLVRELTPVLAVLALVKLTAPVLQDAVRSPRRRAS